jgi:DNA-binding NtrC family response regulator
MEEFKVLIIEDEIIFRKKIEKYLYKIFADKDITLSLFECSTKAKAKSLLMNQKFDMAFFDINLDVKLAGIDLLKKYSDNVDFPVVISSMYESTEIVNLANTYGAQFFLKKPIKESSIQYAVDQFLYFKNDGEFDDYLRSHYITDDDSTIKELRSLKFLKLGDRPVHLNGETGTGKNHVIKLAKDWILGVEAPLIHICCSNIPEELFESEIFGSVKGSHSTSSKDKIGAIEMAEGGILFLDEIDKIPLKIQDKFLKLLDTGEFNRVGENKTKRLNALIFSAASQDLDKLIEQGSFRRDLSGRLRQTNVYLTPLRERKTDISILIEHFIDIHPSGKVVPITENAWEILTEYNWPENIRELQARINKIMDSDISKVTAATLNDLKNKEFHTNYQILTPQLLEKLKKYNGIGPFMETLEAEIVNHCFNNFKRKSKKVSYRTVMRHLDISSRRLYKSLDKTNDEVMRISN